MNELSYATSFTSEDVSEHALQAGSQYARKQDPTIVPIGCVLSFVEGQIGKYDGVVGIETLSVHVEAQVPLDTQIEVSSTRFSDETVRWRVESVIDSDLYYHGQAEIEIHT